LPNYKMPICHLGKKIEVAKEDGTKEMQPITEDMVNMSCRCFTDMQAFFCMEGHLTECHVGMSCSEAECSHYEREMDAEREEQGDDEDDHP